MIQVEGLTYTYPKTQAPAITGLSFQVETGEILGFLGPSGAGKSTTQKVLIGLLRDYEGSVSVAGKNLANWRADYYEQVGVSFELPNHFLKLTALENLTYFSRLYQAKTLAPETVLDWVGLGDAGYMPVSQFSKGMKNRLSVARALLHQPTLLFLDEPTAGLDPVNARRIKDLIKQQQQTGRTIFLTTHDMAVADELCERVAFIIDGEIKVMDQPRQLKLRYGQATVQVVAQTELGPQSHTFSLDKLGQNAAFLSLLNTYPVQTIHSQEATLEDVFIQVTGRELL